MKTILRALALGAIATVTAAAPALAAYPEKPVTVVVPFPPGGSTDTIARAMANKMTASLGQTFVVENRRAPPARSARRASSARPRTATRSWSRRSACLRPTRSCKRACNTTR